ncbi:MAG: RNA polymerase sigma factor [Candidatus Eisenbacteria sp.]|nr:RNA polymerase sigma factor [Candidatus Eisenbacteria bacterium]
MDQPQDHELMLAVREGDLPQMGEIFDRYARRLYNFFLRMTFSPETSEDLVQDTFRRMLEARHTYRDNSRFVPWMFTIARSMHSNHRRKRRREGDEVELTDQILEPRSAPDVEFEKRRNVLLLRTALARLSDEKREAILLSRFENMKYEEIAQVAGCPVGTIKARVHYALKEMSRVFRELGHEVQ